MASGHGSEHPNTAGHPNRSVHRGRWAGDTDDGYDALKDRALTGEGSWPGGDPHNRPMPKWRQEAERQRYRESVAGKRTTNAMWPGPAVEHGPQRP